MTGGRQIHRGKVMLITVLLTLGVIFVNGWTDAPNAIATCIGTRSMQVRHAIWMSAAFNFLGVLVMTRINSSVASTISNMVDFGGETHQALVALCAALFLLLWMAGLWASTTFFRVYNPATRDNTAYLCRCFSLSTLLMYLASRAKRLRALPWALAAANAACAARCSSATGTRPSSSPRPCAGS